MIEKKTTLKEMKKEKDFSWQPLFITFYQAHINGLCRRLEKFFEFEWVFVKDLIR